MTIPFARCVLLNRFFSNAFCSFADANVSSKYYSKQYNYISKILHVNCNACNASGLKFLKQ